MCTMQAAEGTPPQLTALKRQHAEHLLEVVRFAEKQEAERQKRLRHATSKSAMAYLQKRFDTERRQNQTQISRLIQDAHAVEAALNKAGGNTNSEEERGQNGPGNRDRNNPGIDPGNRENGLGAIRAASVSGEGSGGGGGGGSIAAGGGLSSGGKVGGGRGGSECNAFIELPEAGGGGGDSRFISAKQMRFMEHVHKREDSQRIPRAAVGIATKLSRADGTGERRARQRYRKSGGGGGGGGGDNQADGNLAGSRIAAAVSALSAGKPLPLARRGQGEGAALGANPKGDRGAIALSHGTGRRRLLAEKRGILLELKGVVNRQAEALDRLVDSCGDTLGGVRLTSGVGGGSGSSGGSGGSGGSKFSGWDSSNSSRSSAVDVRGYSHKSRGGIASRAEGFAGQGGALYHGSGRAKRTAAISPAAVRGKGKMLLPPRPPENGTSAFLARGGRWGGGGGARVSGRNSVASTASYATYANTGRVKKEDTFGVCRRPTEVPALPL